MNDFWTGATHIFFFAFDSQETERCFPVKKKKTVSQFKAYYVGYNKALLFSKSTSLFKENTHLRQQPHKSILNCSMETHTQCTEAWYQSDDHNSGSFRCWGFFWFCFVFFIDVKHTHIHAHKHLNTHNPPQSRMFCPALMVLLRVCACACVCVCWIEVTVVQPDAALRTDKHILTPETR